MSPARDRRLEYEHIVLGACWKELTTVWPLKTIATDAWSASVLKERLRDTNQRLLPSTYTTLGGATNRARKRRMNETLEALISRYDEGLCNRRELLAALALLVASRPSESAPASLVRCREFNHITLRVSDLAGSKEFYSRLLGLPLIKEDQNTCYLSLGRGFMALWRSSDTGMDHWCVGVEPFTKVRAVNDRGSRDPIRERLKNAGFVLHQDEGDPTIYVRDPDGFLVQLEAPGFKA